MSNKVSKIAKEMKETEILRQNITNTVYGSLVQSTLILREIDWTNEEFVKRFKKAQLPFIEDEDFIKKTVEAVGLKYEDVEGLPLVFVESEKNTLFMPYYYNDDNELVVLPLNKEGVYPSTYYNAIDIHAIDWDN